MRPALLFASAARRWLALLCLSLSALLAACGPPGIVPGLDQCTSHDGGACVLPPKPGVITGSVIYSGTARGDTVLLLFAANNLPPPDGTATTAVAIARVASADLFAGRAGAGPFGAPFIFTLVPPGSYQIRAFIDATGDFDPFFDFTRQPRATDPVGGHVQLDAQGAATLASFAVPENGVAAGINVALGAALPFDPPAFVLAAQQNSLGSLNSLPQNLDRPVHLRLTTLNPGVPHANFTAAHFGVELHRGPDGLAQTSGRDGLVDVWPQVLLRQLTDATGAAVAPQSAAIVPAKVVPLPLLPLLLAASPQDPPIGVDTLDILVEPFAVNAASAQTATPQFLPAIPLGSYQLIVIEKSGQAWTLPNSLGSAPAGSPYLVPSQAAAISFVPALAPTGAISGTVSYSGSAAPSNLIVQAFRADTPFLAPPLGAEQPVRMQIIPATLVPPGSGGVSVPFRITGLPPGRYFVAAIDDVAGTFAPLNLLSTATRADLIGGALDGLGNLVPIDVAAAEIPNTVVTLIGPPGLGGVGIDPPAFSLDESAGPAQFAQDARGTVRLTVKAAPPQFPSGSGNPALTFFTVSLIRDASGHTIDADADGLPEVWPRAFLVLLDPNDPSGLTQAVPAVAIPAAVDPTPFLPALLAGADVTLPVKKLQIVVRPAALAVDDPAHPVRLPVMPAGHYKLILMNRTGQLWQIPNEAGSLALDPRAVCGAVPCGAGQVSTASQSRFFSVVKPSGPVPPGEIDGTLTVLPSALPPGAQPIAAYVFAFDAANPPPPLGTGKPVSVDAHQGLELQSAPGGLSVAYALRGLVPGNSYYLTTVIDTRGDFALDPQLFAAAPGPGAIVGGHVDATQQLAQVTAASPATPQIAVIAGSALPARPSFVLADAAQNPLAADVSLFVDETSGLNPTGIPAPQRLTLQATTVLGPGVGAPAEAASSAFFPVTYQACSASDATQGADADGDNLPDLYPRVLLVLLNQDDPTGLSADPRNLVLPAAIDPTPFLGQLGACNTNAVVPARNLSIIVPPFSVMPNPSGGYTAGPVPQGRYGVVLISATGQVWRLPNELQPALLDATSLLTQAGAALASQGLSVRVAGQVPAPPAAVVQGFVSLANFSPAQASNLIVSLFAVVPGGLPPYGRPIAAQFIPRAAVAAALAVNSGLVGYQLGVQTLPPGGSGNYLVAAVLDSSNAMSPLVTYLSSPTAGDQIAIGSAPVSVGTGGSATAATLTIDNNVATNRLPFPRPAFAFAAGSPASLSLSQTTPLTGVTIVLQPLPVSPALPLTTTTAQFHPVPLLGPGGPVRTGNPCGSPTGPTPYLSTLVVVTPLDTLSLKAPQVVVDACQFCPSLTNTADCSGQLLAVPLPMTTPIHALVLNLVDPTTGSGAVPTGHYAITVVEATGTAWTLPNELGQVGAGGASQTAVFTVAP